MIRTWWCQLMQESHSMKLSGRPWHNSQQTRNGRQKPWWDVTKSFEKNTRARDIRRNEEHPLLPFSAAPPPPPQTPAMQMWALCFCVASYSTVSATETAEGTVQALRDSDTPVCSEDLPCGRRSRKVVLMQGDPEEVRRKAGPFLVFLEISYNKMPCHKGKSKEQK